MATTWVMVLYLYMRTGEPPVIVHGFKSKDACIIAANEIAAKHGLNEQTPHSLAERNWKFNCVSTGE